MDGPVVLHHCWLLSLVCVWVYSRYFRTIAPRSAEFEAYCRSRPLLAALAVVPGHEADVVQRLLALLGKRSELIPAAGGWPWTHHALKVRVGHERGVVRLRIERCRVLRMRERSLPSLNPLLLELAQSGSVVDIWLSAPACVDITGQELAPRGWRLYPGALTPWDEASAPFPALPNDVADAHQEQDAKDRAVDQRLAVVSLHAH